MSFHGQEFDCCECGSHIVRMIQEDTHGLCAQCLHMPGWFRIPELRELLDPEHDGLDRSERLAPPSPDVAP